MYSSLPFRFKYNPSDHPEQLQVRRSQPGNEETWIRSGDGLGSIRLTIAASKPCRVGPAPRTYYFFSLNIARITWTAFSALVAGMVPPVISANFAAPIITLIASPLATERRKA
jgi:hypothetical protein